MRPLWEVSGLCICLILSRLFNAAVTSIVYVENGTSLTLKPNIQGKPEDILWTHNGNKVAEHDLTEFLDYGQFKKRAEIEVSTGQLKVHQMTSHDSGIYRSVIQINGKLQNSDNEVQVIDAVPEPVVTCHLTNISRALFCSVSSQSRVSYAWTGSSSAQQSGPELQLSGEEEPDSVYTCTVKNEVSQRSSSFSLKHCDTDEPQSYENSILPVAVIAAVILVIIAVAVGIYLFKRNKTNENSGRSGGESLEMNNDQGGSSDNQAPNGNLAPGNRNDEEGEASGQYAGITSQSVDNNEGDRIYVEEPTNDTQQRRRDSEDVHETDPLVQEEQEKSDSETASDSEEEEDSEEQHLTGAEHDRREEPDDGDTELT